jgi:acyl-coenzyme A synthetase/AMP-(fatty) acid ligase
MSLSESNQLPLLRATLQDIVATQAAQLGESPAILAPGRLPLSFARLHQHITDTRSRLWKLGIGRGDIVINVLPSGSDAAVASLCIASCATVAVLNPDLLELEYASLFEKLTPKLVIAYPGQAQAARGCTANQCDRSGGAFSKGSRRVHHCKRCPATRQYSVGPPGRSG